MNKIFLSDIGFFNIATDQITGVLCGINSIPIPVGTTAEVAALNFPTIFKGVYDAEGTITGLQMLRFESDVMCSIAVASVDGDYEVPVIDGVECFVGGRPNDR